MFGSKLSIKPNKEFRLYFENDNDLNINNSAWKSSHKCRRLKQLLRKYEVYLIGLVETQINPELLARGKDAKEILFRSVVNNDVFTNTTNELIDFRQQGGVFPRTEEN